MKSHQSGITGAKIKLQLEKSDSKMIERKDVFFTTSCFEISAVKA